jgi:battenin
MFAGLINNVLYVVILSAALDLVGPDFPKGIVLLADVVPSFGTKLVLPYFIHVVPYSIRVLIFVTLSVMGMLVIALTPDYTDGGTITMKLAGVILASLSSGGGELSFLGLTHFYGPFSLAAWGSGTGAAGLIGAGAYAVATTSLGLSVKATLLASACLPAIMVISYFIILPKYPRHYMSPVQSEYRAVAGGDGDEEVEVDQEDRGGEWHERDGLLDSPENAIHKPARNGNVPDGWSRFRANLKRAKGLFIPLYVDIDMKLCCMDADPIFNWQYASSAPSLYRRIYHQPRSRPHSSVPAERNSFPTFSGLLPGLQRHLSGWSLPLAIFNPIFPHP